jgi:hypothetical protein
VNFRKDGFVFKTGGYTTAQDRKKLQCWVSAFVENPQDNSQFDKVATRNKTTHLIGEIDDD